MIAGGAVGATTLWGVVLAVLNRHWYAGLLKPTFAPSPWLAGAAWLALGMSIAGGLHRILEQADYLPDRPGALRMVFISLGLDVAWCWLFFAGRHPSVALAVAAALAVATMVTAWRFAVVDRRAGMLLLPWVVAAIFIFLVDLSIAQRNT